ncbi:MAG: iron ABC transporter permease [Treponema sp.]|nr:iron ABC transporter permease [Treponema sp.]
MKSYKNKYISLLFTFGIIILFVVFIASLVMGTEAISVKNAILALLNAGETKSKTIIYSIRLPRSLAAVICGAGLSVAGLLLQSALKNPLASPGILGLNTGAGFFVLLASLFFPYLTITKSLFAFLGSITAISIVYIISINAGFSKSSLILAGVAISSLMTAGIDIIITLYPDIVADKISFNLGGF